MHTNSFEKLLKYYNIKLLYYISYGGNRYMCLKRFDLTIEVILNKISDLEPSDTIDIILKEFRQHPEYPKALYDHVNKPKDKKELPKLLTIDDKKRRIREYLIEEGIIKC